MHLVHVEDDRLERELVRATLEQRPSGPALHHCATIVEAIALVAQLKGPVAVLCDHQLTDGTARDLLRAVVDRPEVRVVVLSGCITPKVAALQKHANVVAVFEKPMGLADLERIVNTALGPLPSLTRN